MSTYTFLSAPTDDLADYMPTDYRGAVKADCKVLGIVQQEGEVDFAEALKAAKRKWGSFAEIRGEGDDMEDGGCQYLVISQP